MWLDERTLAVIEAFYDAAMDESLWPVALQGLADLTGSQAASFWRLDGSDGPRLPTFICINFDQESVNEYLQGMASLDPTNRYLLRHPQQAIVHDGLLPATRDNDSRAYYDWHERSVETRFRMIGKTQVGPYGQAGVALHRTRKAGPFEARDIHSFTVLHGHLRRALAIAFRLGSLGNFQQFSIEWLDRNPAGIVLLDQRKRVIYANRAAQAMAATRDGIQLSVNGVRLAHSQSNAKLASLLAQALSPVTFLRTETGGAMRAIRPSAKRAYGVFVAPISRGSAALAPFRPAACIVITDPEQQPMLAARRVQAAFGLTGAEARMAVLLAAGRDLRSAAEELHITYSTARSRLSEIFQKTGTRRQSDLVCLLLRTIPENSVG